MTSMTVSSAMNMTLFTLAVVAITVGPFHDTGGTFGRMATVPMAMAVAAGLSGFKA